MWSNQYPLMPKSLATFLDNSTLSILEYILVEGIDGALAHFKGISEEDVRVFPNVMRALRERGYLNSEKSELN